MVNLTRFETVICDDAVLYVYSLKLNRVLIFKDLSIIENTFMQPYWYVKKNNPSDKSIDYTVSQKDGEVLHNSTAFKVWLKKGSDPAIAYKALVSAIDIYIANQVKKHIDSIKKLEGVQNTFYEAISKYINESDTYDKTID